MGVPGGHLPLQLSSCFPDRLGTRSILPGRSSLQAAVQGTSVATGSSCPAAGGRGHNPPWNSLVPGPLQFTQTIRNPRGGLTAPLHWPSPQGPSGGARLRRKQGACRVLSGRPARGRVPPARLFQQPLAHALEGGLCAPAGGEGTWAFFTARIHTVFTKAWHPSVLLLRARPNNPQNKNHEKNWNVHPNVQTGNFAGGVEQKHERP